MTINRSDLDTVDFSDIEAGHILPTRPGEVLLHDYLEPLGLSAYALAQSIEVPTNRVTAIINGTRVITADTALRLARRLGTSPEMWMNLQTGYDLAMAREARAA